MAMGGQMVAVNSSIYVIRWTLEVGWTGGGDLDALGVKWPWVA